MEGDQLLGTEGRGGEEQMLGAEVPKSYTCGLVWAGGYVDLQGRGKARA